MSYASRASRRTQAAGGGGASGDRDSSRAAAPPPVTRPQIHSRKHSANSAGDVFAMLGQPMASKVSAARDKDRQATIHEQSASEENASLQKVQSDGKQANEALSSPSSSSPSTPSSSLPTTAGASTKSAYSQGRPTMKRYKTHYSKRTLLKLWRSHLSVNAALDDLYSAFETPEQQQLQLEGTAGSKYHSGRPHGHGHAEGGERANTHDRGPRRDRERERDALGRLPALGNTAATGTSASSPGLALPPNTRRTSSGTGNFGPGSLAGVFQGGVLPGVGGTANKKTEAGSPASMDFQRAPASARSRLFNERDKQVGTALSSASWSSNRWRHLQADEDSHISSSGSSTKDENEDNDLWSKPVEASEGQWRPGQHDPIEREKQAMQRGSNATGVAPSRNGQDVLAQSSWRKQEPLADAQASTGQADRSFGEDAHVSNKAGNNEAQSGRPQLPTSASNQSLFLDDLLGPTRQQNQPTSVSSSRSNSLANAMSTMAINTSDAGLSSSGPQSSRFRNSASSTPTRASAAEGLELLARRSPVQELSMAALQQQRPLHTPIGGAPHHSRPPPPPHPTNEPADRIFWQYRDPQGQLQGPFSVIQMQEWYGQGFFNDTLLVKRVESSDYETLGALIIRLHDVHLPFFSAPLIQPAFGAPPGMQAPGLGHPPFHRMASPVTWQQQQQASIIPEQVQQYPTPEQQQRTSSFTAGNAVFDLFSKAQQPQPHSPESMTTSLPAVPEPEQTSQAPTSGPVHDPWADMNPASVSGASIPRGSSALGGEPVEAENALFRQSAPGQHLSNSANSARQDSLPAPIGRSSSMSVPKDTSSPKPVQPITSPAKKDSTQLPVVEGTPASIPTVQVKQPTPQQQEATAAVSKSAVSTTSQPKLETAPVVEKAIPRTVPASQVAKTGQTTSATATTTKPLQVSTGAKGDGVNVVTQESFDKQKKGPAASEAAAEVSLASLAPASSPPLGTPSSARKAAPWAKSMDDKASSGDAGLGKSNAGMSLREIQAKEQKEAEARRAQEKKVLAAQRAAQEAALAERRAREASEGLPMTARWGDSAASSPVIPAAASAPWAKLAPAAASASKSGKKTLKEIQEEEEARRKAAQQAQAQKVSKAYANTISQAPAAMASDSPWQTVGAPKPSAPSSTASSAVRPPGMNGSSSVAAAPRPVVQPGNSMASKLAGQAVKPSTPVAAPATIRTLSAASSTPAAAVSASSSKDDEPAFPASSDLLKWCKEALKGLEIPIDDFIQMLLSFPVPLDKSTRELISDSVYASSRTLDGRYFSDAFADKRLADTKAIKLGKQVPVSLASYFGLSATKPSMADAIKFIPAQKGPEMNFKVVTKSKGKRK